MLASEKKKNQTVANILVQKKPTFSKEFKVPQMRFSTSFLYTVLCEGKRRKISFENGALFRKFQKQFKEQGMNKRPFNNQPIQGQELETYTELIPVHLKKIIWKNLKAEENLLEILIFSFVFYFLHHVKLLPR